MASYYISVAKRLGKELGIEEICNGKTDVDDRLLVLSDFNDNKTNLIILTGIIEKMRLKNIDVLISLSYLKGSAREEYKRIGKLKSSNGWNSTLSYYYALVTQGTIEEVKYIERRYQMIIRGYDFSILTLKELRGKAYET